MKEMKEMKDELRQLNHKYDEMDWYQLGLDLKWQLEDDLFPKLDEQLDWQLLNQLERRLHRQLNKQLKEKYDEK